MRPGWLPTEAPVQAALAWSSRLGTKDPMAPSSRHLYPEWLRPRNPRVARAAGGRRTIVGTRGRGRSGNGCAPSTAATPPWSTSSWRRGCSSCARAGSSNARRTPPEPLVRGGPDLPADLPAPGADDGLPRHRRGGVRPVARHRSARWPTSRSSSRSTPSPSNREWPLVAAAVVILEAGVVMATVRWDLTRQQRPVLRLPHRPGLHRAAGRGGGPGPAQPARLAGRARRAAGARARPAGVAGRGDGTGPHCAGDARCGLAQHPGDGHPGRRRLHGAGRRTRPGRPRPSTRCRAPDARR